MDNIKNLMKWHIAAVKMILSIDEPILPAEKINQLKKYSDELNLQWSVDLMNFFLKATMGTLSIWKVLEQTENPNRISRQKRKSLL